MSHPLDALFFPGRIGVIGLSSRPGTWGRRVVELLEAGDYEGTVYAVEPRDADPGRLPIIGDLLEEGQLLDLLVVAVPSAAAVDVVERARRGGVAAVVLFTSGFAEEGEAGRLLQQRLRAAAGDMPLLGPNCLGLISRPAATQVTASAYAERPTPPAGPLAIVTQSGAMGFVLAGLLNQRGAAFSYYASVGNEACLQFTDVGAYLLELPDVQILGLYVEQVRDPAALTRLGHRAAELGKRVVVLKAGVSEAGGRATLSHTAAVAGDHLLFTTLCRDAGVVIAEDDESFADLVSAGQRPITLPDRPRFAVLSMSGGAGAVIADRLAALGAETPELGTDTRAALQTLDLPGVAATGNPIDLGGQFYRSTDALDDLLSVLDHDSGLDGIICYFTFGDHFPHIFRRLAQTLAELKTPSWLIWACPPEGALTGTAPGLVHTSIASLMRALPGHLRTPPGEPAGTSAPPDAAASAARALAHLPSRPGVVTETTASRILRELGVPYVECLDVETAAAAQTPAEGNRGPDAQRFVVKVDSPDAPHRARLGLLRLGAHGADVPEEAAALRRQAADQDLRDAHIVVQPQLSHRGELSIGAVRDPSYGPALIVGAGGSRAEDTSAARHAILLPAAPAAVQHTAAALAAEHPGLDAKELARILFLVAEFVSRAPTVAELDINPLLVRDDGSLTAVDSLMVLATPEPSTSV